MENNQNKLGNLSAPFRALIGNEELFYQFLDLHPTPLQVFSPDGLSMFANRAFLEQFNTDVDSLVGHYNLKHDPVCLGILGQDLMDRIFRGEACSFYGFPLPLDDAANRGVIKEKPFEAATADIFSQPLWVGEIFTCTICFFTVKSIYHGNAEIVKVKQYIDRHWLDDYDIKVVAGALHISPNHLNVLFRSNTGMTIKEYYESVKVEHIKEKLKDMNLTVADAFSFCNADSRGGFGKIFRKLTDMTPKEYKESLK